MTSSLLLQNLLKSPDQPSCKTCHSIEKRPSHGQRNLASYSLSGSQRVGHHLASERWPLLVCSLSLLRTYACILSSLICHSIFFLQIYILQIRSLNPLYGAHAQSLSHVWIFEIPWILACQALLSMGFPRQEYWSGFPFPPPGNLPDPGIEPRSPALTGRFFTMSHPGGPNSLHTVSVPSLTLLIFEYKTLFFPVQTWNQPFL